MAKHGSKHGRVAILANGDRVTVVEVERVISKSPKISEWVWFDHTDSGKVVRLADGRTFLASHVNLTDESAEVPRRKVIAPEPEPTESDNVSDTDGEELEPDPSELQPLSFAALEPDEDAVAVMTTDPEEGGESSGDPEIDQETEE